MNKKEREQFEQDRKSLDYCIDWDFGFGWILIENQRRKKVARRFMKNIIWICKKCKEEHTLPVCVTSCLCWNCNVDLQKKRNNNTKEFFDELEEIEEQAYKTAMKESAKINLERKEK